MTESPDYLDVLGAICALVADGYGVRVWSGRRDFDGLAVCVVYAADRGYLVSLTDGDAIVASGDSAYDDSADGLLFAADRCEESRREYYARRIDATVPL